MQGNEVEAAKAATADWSAFSDKVQQWIDQQQEEIINLKERLSTLETERDTDREWIELLRSHINDGKGPPAPGRPSK